VHYKPNWGLSVLPTESDTKGLELTRAQRVLRRARLQNGTDALTSMRNCKTLEVRFRALLTQEEIRQLEVVRA
jgi:hypothetical protein